MLRIRSYGQGLVVAKSAIVVELNGPPTFHISTHPWPIDHLIADNLDLAGFWPNKVHKKGADDGHHTRGENNHRDSIGLRPMEKSFEVGIERDVFTENFDALGKGCLDAVQHVLEGVAVTDKKVI